MSLLHSAPIAWVLVNMVLGYQDTVFTSRETEETLQSSQHGASPQETVPSKGIASTALEEEHPECPEPTSHVVLNHTFAKYVSNCTCSCDEGKLGWFKNGTPCFALGLGYNQEMTSKHGECYNGICVLNDIPLGCVGAKYDHLRTPKNDTDGNPPVGCAFLCRGPNPRNETFHDEFGYYPEGSLCLHVVHPGTYEDGPVRGWVNATYNVTTCKKSGNETLCRDKVEAVPVC